MRGLRLCTAALMLAAAAWGAAPLQAQETAPPALPFATLDETRLLAGSRSGQRILQRFETAQMALAAENREIEASLVEREQALTNRRETLPADEFRRLADSFNAEVETYRRTQSDKERAVYLEHDADRRRFRLASNGVLTEVMRARGIQAIISEDAIILAFKGIDITDALIAGMDAITSPDGELILPEDPGQEGGTGDSPE